MWAAQSSGGHLASSPLGAGVVGGLASSFNGSSPPPGVQKSILKFVIKELGYSKFFYFFPKFLFLSQMIFVLDFFQPSGVLSLSLVKDFYSIT